MSLITIAADRCENCGLCAKDCTNKVLFQEGKQLPEVVAEENCIECGHCLAVCPGQAITHAGLPDENRVAVNYAGITPDNIENFLLSRRSIRLYKRKPVEQGILERLIRVADMAPTAKNCQERGFIVVSDPEKIRKISKALLAHNEKVIFWLKVATGRILSKLMDHETVDALKRLLHGFRITQEKAAKGEHAIFHDAPCLVFIYGIGKDPLGKDNCLSAQQYLMSQAQAMGLGTCIIGYAQAAPKVLADHLSIPKHYKVYGALTLGYPQVRYHRTVERKKPTISWVGRPQDSRTLKSA